MWPFYLLKYFNQVWVLGTFYNSDNCFTHLRGNILRATSMPGQYDRKAASAVSSNRPKMRIRFLRKQRRAKVRTTTMCVSWSESRSFTCTYFIPCWRIEFLLVLQMIRSAHWTTTMLAKKAVWQVNSTIFLRSYVWWKQHDGKKDEYVFLHSSPLGNGTALGLDYTKCFHSESSLTVFVHSNVNNPSTQSGKVPFYIFQSTQTIQSYEVFGKRGGHFVKKRQPFRTLDKWFSGHVG